VSDFDRHQRILPSSVLDLFQDVAGVHAEMLGVSGPQLLERNLCWMITRARFEILKQPALYKSVVVRTWPIESRRIELDRDYEIYSEDGELLIRGTSAWVVMDITDRTSPKLVMARDFDLGLTEYKTERAFERAFGRAVYTKILSDTPYSYSPVYTDLDMNGHVNNTKYAALTLNAVADTLGERKIFDVRIDFAKEVLLGDTLLIHSESKENEDGSLTISARGETDSSPMNFGVIFTAK
jgi:acyl-ACP thioesterase